MTTTTPAPVTPADAQKYAISLQAASLREARIARRELAHKIAESAANVERNVFALLNQVMREGNYPAACAVEAEWKKAQKRREETLTDWLKMLP